VDKYRVLSGVGHIQGARSSPVLCADRGQGRERKETLSTGVDGLDESISTSVIEDRLDAPCPMHEGGMQGARTARRRIVRTCPPGTPAMAPMNGFTCAFTSQPLRFPVSSLHSAERFSLSGTPWHSMARRRAPRTFAASQHAISGQIVLASSFYWCFAHMQLLFLVRNGESRWQRF
jgi:hypothetical protein